MLDRAVLAAAGCGPDLARRAVADGAWLRPARGLYVPHTGALDQSELAHLTMAVAGPHALLTGLIAADALGLRWIPPAIRGQAVVPATVRRTANQLVEVRRTATFAELDAQAWTWQGLRVAPPGRIVFDAVRGLDDLRAARGVVLGALQDRWTTVDEQRELLAREPRNGTGLLRCALSDADDGAASPPEAELADVLRGCRQPYLLNPDLRIGGQLIGRPDGWFLGLGAGWEMDSRERHEGDDQFDATLARHGRFGAYGLVLAHPTPRLLRRDPAATAAAVLAVARSRLALTAGSREPAGLEVVPCGPVLR